MTVRPADEAGIAEAGRLLAAGGLVAFPTETVYGLGADATQPMAVARIYAAKGRPSFNPLIVHVTDLAAAERIARLTPAARLLAAAFWPGSLTLVLPLRPDSAIAELVTAGLDTVAIRVPSSLVARAVLAAAGCPVAAPSANRSGHVSATEAGHVAADLEASVDLILDGGATTCGVESTIVDATGDTPCLLRPGAVTADEIEAVLGRPLAIGVAESAKPSAPGQLASHYAPATRVRLAVERPRPDEALLAFGPDVPPHAGPVVNLSARGDLIEAAARLFSALRRLDAAGCAAIAVMPVPELGLGVAINDRLRRAAADR